MTPETLEKALRINKEISELKNFKAELNDDSYMIDLRFIKQEKFSDRDILSKSFRYPERCIFCDIESLKYIFDKHEAMIRKEIDERIEELNKKISAL